MYDCTSQFIYSYSYKNDFLTRYTLSMYICMYIVNHADKNKIKMYIVNH